MALSGLEIYKHLPKTNCKKCGYPTCLAFAMKLAQKGAELSTCPDISDTAKEALDAASRPPIRLVTLGTADKKFEVGNETVMFRHEKTFFHEPGLLVRVRDTEPAAEVARRVEEATTYFIERVGMCLGVNGIAIDNASGEVGAFVQCVDLVAKKTDWPVMLMSRNPAAIAGALPKVAARSPLIWAANKDNAAEMAKLALDHKASLAVQSSDGLSELSGLVETVTKLGVQDVVLDPGVRSFGDSLTVLTQLRRLALKKNFRPLGYPIVTFPGEGAQSVEEEALLAGQQIAKYAGIVVLDRFSPSLVYPLLTLRQNIYTDPQKPIQMQPGVYEIGDPKPESPLFVTTNFSLTYFSVVGEIEASGFPGWLLLPDAEGLSVLTAWAAGKFDAEKIAKFLKSTGVAEKLAHKTLIIPGHLATISGELEDELPDWQIRVGPREAVDIGSYLKRTWGK